MANKKKIRVGMSIKTINPTYHNDFKFPPGITGEIIYKDRRVGWEAGWYVYDVNFVINMGPCELHFIKELTENEFEVI